ncbi:MAG TPA: ATP-binding protein [Myxococcota bacterium]
MHPAVLIPLATAFGAAALAAAIAAREPGQRANRLVAAVLLCDVWWALFEVLCLTAKDAGSALPFARLAALGSILLSPVALHLMAVVMPDPRLPRRWIVTAQYAIGAALVLAALGGPWFTPDVTRESWGFVPRIGPLVPWAYLALLLVPVLTLLRALRLRTLERVTPSRGTPWVELAIGLTMLVASITDFLLPTLGKPVPRLGSASVAAWGLVTWWMAYRFRAAGLSPRQFASEILATLPDGVALVRLDGRIRGVNAKLAQLAKRDSDDLVGRPVGELIQEPPEAAGGAERECELRSASGARVPVSISDAWLHDESGFAIGRVLVVRDLEELVSLRSRLLTSARLAAVGQLAAGIAHEINNPIAYVRSNVGLLERHWNDLAEVFESRAAAPNTYAALTRSRELLRAAADGIDRIASIVRDVGGFSWKGGSENEPADPVELLETALRVAGPQLRRKASVERSFVKLPLVPCRPQELMQVFLNLVLAGVNTIEERGQLALSAGIDGGFVWVEIATDGAGLTPEDLERIFDPFSPSPDGVAQAGLGLAISRQIVERQGGRIQVESQPGRGMRFRVLLPVTAPAAEGGD